MESFEPYKTYIIGGIAACAAGYILNKIYFSGGICKSKRRLDGKTVIITGANTGLGKETALELCKRGARVIMACRDLNKALIASEEIKQIYADANLVLEKLDLASMASIRSFADKINKQEDQISVLINNGGKIMFLG